MSENATQMPERDVWYDVEVQDANLAALRQQLTDANQRALTLQYQLDDEEKRAETAEAQRDVLQRQVGEARDIAIGYHEGYVSSSRVQAFIRKWDAEREATIRAERTASAPPQEATCEWVESSGGEYWDTACRATWCFEEGGVAENGVTFCHNCGKRVVAVPYVDEPDSDEELDAATPQESEAELISDQRDIVDALELMRRAPPQGTETREA